MNILTENAITELYNAESTQSSHGNYVVQILSIKSIEPEGTGPKRCVIVISDGKYQAQAVIAKNCGSLVDTGHLAKYSIIRVTNAIINTATRRRMLVILEFEILTNYPLTFIGNPTQARITGAPAQNINTLPQQSNHQIQPIQQNRPIQQPNQQLQQTTQPLRQPTQQLHHQPEQSTQRVQQPIQHSIQRPIQQPIQRPIQQREQSMYRQTNPTQQPLFMQGSGKSYPVEFSNELPETSLFAINCLNPYRNKWMIKARVVQKSDVKTWINSRTEGKLFSVNLLDKTGEIKATAFQREVDRLYPILTEGQVFYISNARVVMAKKQYSTLDNEYELTLESGTEVQWCPEDSSIPDMNYSFTKIADIISKEKSDTLDVIGVVRKATSVMEFINKLTGAPMQKRVLTIVDETQMAIGVSIWGRIAEQFDAPRLSVVAFKRVKVNEYNGRSLSLQHDGVMKVNPDIHEAHELESWYRDYGHQAVYSGFANASSFSDTNTNPQKMTIGDAKHKYQLGQHETAEIFAVRGTIMYIKTDSFCYPACPECNKKLILDTNIWRCEKCSMVHTAPTYKYVLSLTIEDDTSELFVTVFDKTAEQLLKKSANELTQLATSIDLDRLQMSTGFELPRYKSYNFTIKAQQRVYNNVPSTQYVVLDATSVDFVAEGQNLVQMIDLLLTSAH